MKSGKRNAFPFAVDRTSPTGLAEQVFEGFCAAIRAGVYRVGEALPTWRETARALGVSDRVLRTAMAKLARQGVVVSHGRGGCLVANTSLRKRWKGMVLAVQDANTAMTYSSQDEIMQLAKALVRAGSALVPVMVDEIAGGKAREAFSIVEQVTSFDVDFVLMLCDGTPLARWLSRRRIPFASYNRYDVPNFVGSLPGYDFTKAIDRFVRACLQAGVRNVLQVSFAGVELFDAVPALRAAGIEADCWAVPVAGRRIAVNVRKSGEQAFTERLRKDRDWLPDVILFLDDYLATGALSALAYAGVKVPEDVRFVTFANRGDEPAFPVAPTLIRLDNGRRGRLFAEAVAAYQRTGKWPKLRPVAAEYVPGDTFKVLKRTNKGKGRRR